jgi:HAMP domain-containing protein
MRVFAITPALPLHAAGPYVAAAYIVFLAVILIYVAIMARRLVRNQRELAELRRELQERERPAPAEASTPEREVSHQL